MTPEPGATAPLVFVSHASSQHALALALSLRLRQAGFEACIYDPRAPRPPSQVDEWERVRHVWADMATAGDMVNISHLRGPLERAAFVLLLDDAEDASAIESDHTRGEILFANLLSRLRRRAPAIVAVPPAHVRELVLEGSADDLRRTLQALGRRHRWRLTVPLMSAALAVVLALVAAAALAAPLGSTAFVACIAVLALGLPLWALAASLPRWMLPFGGAAFLGEVNVLSPVVTTLFGHRTRQMPQGDLQAALEAEVHREIVIAAMTGPRLAILRVVAALPSLLLRVLMPLALVAGLAAIALALG